MDCLEFDDVHNRKILRILSSKKSSLRDMKFKGDLKNIVYKKRILIADPEGNKRGELDIESFLIPLSKIRVRLEADDILTSNDDFFSNSAGNPKDAEEITMLEDILIKTGKGIKVILYPKKVRK